jgi:hypothetical protein
VVLNVTRQPAVLSIPAGNYLVGGAVLRDVWTGETLTVAEGRLEGVRVAARGGTVLIAEE